MSPTGCTHCGARTLLLPTGGLMSCRPCLHHLAVLAWVVLLPAELGRGAFNDTNNTAPHDAGLRPRKREIK